MDAKRAQHRPTRVEKPQDARNGALVAFTLALLVCTAAIILAFRSLPDPAPVIASQPPPPTQVARLEMPAVETMVALLLVTPTATATPTERPTPYPTVDVTINRCSNVTPRAGLECQRDPAPTATTEPRPSCDDDGPPGSWCKWYAVDETTGAAEVGPEYAGGSRSQSAPTVATPYAAYPGGE